MPWEPGRDQYGNVCWRHKINKTIQYVDPWLAAEPQPLGGNPNAMHHIVFFPNSNPTPPVQEEWEMYRDEKNDNRPYWFNRTTGKTQWENPHKAAQKPPPPPRENKEKTPEYEQWKRKYSRTRGNYWYNEVTGEVQTAIPECRRKYK